MCPSVALKKLIDGNKRFAEGKSEHPNLGIELRNSLVKAQKPFAAVLACSDSRVPVEIIFDVGLGDIFVVRSAGHVLSKETLGSLEYAVDDLGVKTILILGHENCGAVTTALNLYKNSNSEVTENINSLMSHIYPALGRADLTSEHDCLANAVQANIDYQVKEITKLSPLLAKKIENKELILAGAKYSLNTGLVDVFYDGEKSCCCSK